MNMSDHFPTFSKFTLPNATKTDKVKTVEYRDFSENNINNFKDHLENIDWQLVLTATNPNVAYDNFSTIFNAGFDNFFPLKTKHIKMKSFVKPYITAELKQLIAEKNKLQKKFSKWPLTYGEEFRRLRNEVTRRIRNAKTKYYAEKFETCNGDSKKTWKILNTLLNRKTKTELSHMEIDNKIVTDSKQIAEHLNSFFVNASKNLADAIPQSTFNHTDYFGDRIINCLDIINITENDVLTATKQLRNSSPGDDEVPISLIKEIITVIMPIIIHIFNCSLAIGVFPDQLKIAKVLPLHKTGDTRYANNFRQISNLLCFSKLFEKIIYNKLTDYLDRNNIISKCQFGFKANSSTSDAITHLTNHIYKEFDKQNYTLAICIDFSKAFDTINHEILLDKLKHIGIRGTLLHWFKSYLSNRKQFVSFNGNKSSPLFIENGVPQGSILGPILFLIYINDIINTSELLNFTLYADDSIIYVSGNSINDIILAANQELNKVLNWVTCNKLTLNMEKTHYVIFNRNKTFPMDIQPLLINNQPVKREQITKFLGVSLDEKLNFKKHISNIQTKINKQSGIMYHTKSSLTPNAMKQIYYSLIYPHLNYCQTVWGAVNKTSLQPLVITQKKVIRTISGLRKYDHTNDSFKNLKLLKLNDINVYTCATYVFTSLNLRHNDMFTSRHNPNYQLRHSKLLQIPQIQSLQSKSCILFHGVTVWNSLPATIRETNNIHTFKRKLKQHLLSRY